MLAELVDRMASLVLVLGFLDMGVAHSRTTYVPFRRFWGDVWREFMQRLSAALHGTLGSYLRDALHEGSADAVACLHVPQP
jgi:hypothetical protein